jgi:hypothetical protein
MKSIRNVLIRLGLLTLTVFLHESAFSAETASPDFSAQLAAVEGTEPTPAAAVPRTGQFYSARLANAGLILAPILPGGMGMDAWNLGDNVWLVNDLEPVTSLRNGMRMMADGGPLPPGAGGGSTNGGVIFYPQAQSFTTNQLWLENIAVINQTDSLVIHPPWGISNGVYDLYYTTNLVPPVAWSWLFRTDAGQTNLLVHNATDAQGFYRLGPPDDLAATSSLGTNFWVAFGDLHSDNGNQLLSLSISSPVGAVGTVTAPGLMQNGPVLVFTNGGDAAVNGAYALTNLTAQEKTDLQTSGLSPADFAYMYGTNWVVWQGAFWVLLAYDPVAHFGMTLYDKPEVNLNGDWEYDGDFATPPTSICAPIPLVNQTFTVAAGGGDEHQHSAAGHVEGLRRGDGQWHPCPRQSAGRSLWGGLYSSKQRRLYGVSEHAVGN